MNKTDIDKFIKENQKKWDSIYGSHFEGSKTLRTIKEIVVDILVAVGSDTHSFEGMQETINNLKVVNESLAKNNVKFYVGNTDMVETYEYVTYLQMIEPSKGILTRIKEFFK